MESIFQAQLICKDNDFFLRGGFCPTKIRSIYGVISIFSIFLWNIIITGKTVRQENKLSYFFVEKDRKY